MAPLDSADGALRSMCRVVAKLLHPSDVLEQKSEEPPDLPETVEPPPPAEPGGNSAMTLKTSPVPPLEMHLEDFGRFCKLEADESLPQHVRSSHSVDSKLLELRGCSGTSETSTTSSARFQRRSFCMGKGRGSELAASQVILGLHYIKI